jgi:hypothetical protein
MAKEYNTRDESEESPEEIIRKRKQKPVKRIKKRDGKVQPK